MPLGLSIIFFDLGRTLYNPSFPWEYISPDSDFIIEVVLNGRFKYVFFKFPEVNLVITTLELFSLP